MQDHFRQFMDHTGSAPIVPQIQDVSNTPRYIVDPAMARRETRNTRRRRRFDNHSFSGKEAKPTQQTLREKATTEGPTTPLRMCVSLHNLAKVCGMFRGHITLYVGKYTEERKFQAMFDKYFTERPLTLAVDFEWVANYDPDDHPVHHRHSVYRCYAVDVGIYSTGKCTMVVHHAQFNEHKWGKPGPYIAKKAKRPQVSEGVLSTL